MKHALILAANDTGIPWLTLLALLEQYGFPIVLKVLQALLAGNLKGVTIAQMVAWVEAAALAISQGQPLPPLPTPMPAPAP